ncbi:hypothetical protein [Haloarchaeobius sp. HRN-SO-5]|uniref:hypothetical protein n=1 Tax=Haloarchaeobius sp. HRN-SO-5 TaxID=3446118 RepID=UPI003EB72FB0
MTLLVVAVALAAVPTASAHEGTVHGGVPHLALLGTLVVGLAALAGIAVLDRAGALDRVLSPRATALALVTGVSLAALGAMGLVEVQVEPVGTAVTTRAWYPALTFFGGMGIVVGSLGCYLWRWGDHHAYPILGTVLGLWVAYPELIPRGATTHPLGYVLVLAVPVVLGYLYWTELRPAVRRLDRRSGLVGLAGGVAFGGFFVVSSGLFTLNPDVVSQAGGEPFTVVTTFASPLVSWPAVETYRPSVPLFAALSVGTGLVVAVLAGLVGLNAAFGTAVWRRRDEVSTDGGTDVEASALPGVTGAVATTGATACCCCGPALYGVASAAMGASASPIYWAFTDPASPLATLFLVAAIALLSASALTLATSVRQVCEVPSA